MRIAIAGKGGTGKSIVATNLAVQRAKMGERMKNREAQMQERRQRMQRDPAERPARS